MYTKETLMEDLRRMGLKGTDTVMVHSSMKAIGAVEGRADAVLDALSDYFAPGLLMLPTLTWNLAWEKEPVFDVRKTPSLVGILPQLFRKREGVVRSLHPTHSVAALGRDAAAVTKECHLCGTPCGERSAWHKLMERDGFILMVGCTLTSCTFIHGVEEWCRIPDRLEEPMHFTCVDAKGGRHDVVSRAHKGSPSEQYGRAERALRDGGALADGQFGDARVMVIRAKKCFDIVAALLREEPQLFSE